MYLLNCCRVNDFGYMKFIYLHSGEETNYVELSSTIHLFRLSFAQVVSEPSRYPEASVKSYVRTQQLCSVAFCSVSKSCKSTDLTESYYIEGKECL